MPLSKLKIEDGKLPADVPAEALRLAASVEFAGAGDDGTYPVTIRARSSQPIDHPYWGRLVHDMTGMFETRPTVPIDYLHRQDEALGFGDTATADETDGLVISGRLTPFHPLDRATEVITKSRLGVPYEASLDYGWDGIQLEFVPEQALAQVNGYEFEGPGVIVRKWPLRGVAICLYGQDYDTETQLTARPNVRVSYLNEESIMPVNKTTPAKGAGKKGAATDSKSGKPGKLSEEKGQAGAGTAVADETQAESETETEEDAEAEVETETETQAEGGEGAGDPKREPAAAGGTQLSAGKEFMEAFGPQGAVWYLEGKSFAEATKLHAKGQADKLAALELENNKLKQTVTGLRGEKEPLSGQPADSGKPDESVNKLAAKGASESFAKYAASIKLPGKKQ